MLCLSDVFGLCVMGNEKYSPVLRRFLAQAGITEAKSDQTVFFDPGGHFLLTSRSSFLSPIIHGNVGTENSRCSADRQPFDLC